MVSELIPVEFLNEKTRRLADLSGVLHDLRATSAICARLKKVMAEPPDKHGRLEIEALQAAAIIRYCRAFAGGVRHAFNLNKEMIGLLSAQLQAAHKEFDDLRDKHFAHSVNDWELNIPVVYLTHDRVANTFEIHSVSVQHHRIVAMAEASIDQLWEIARTLSEMVEAEIEKERSLVLELAKAAPIQSFKDAINNPAKFPGVGKIERPRASGKPWAK